MCGICGVVFAGVDPAAEQQALAMRDLLVHRGPDDAGCISASGSVLSTTRLAVLDLSERGHMPMSTSDGRYHITYNGEVYNYRELRATLRSKGFTFKSNTDTEVLLNLYVDQGADMLSQLNGMFAFAIWDSREATLFMARDRLGIKPLYYAEHAGHFYFASEEKALLAAGVPGYFDHGTWSELLLFRYVAGENTPYNGISRLLPGHYMTWQDGKFQTKRWWNLADRVRCLREEPLREPLKWFRETFDDSIRLRRISDVPVGVLLSGGLDSGSVAAALALQAGSQVSSFTVRFDVPGYDEGPIAKQVAERWKLDYHELTVPGDELMGRLLRAAWFNDEPLAHGHDLHLLAISEYAKPLVTVLLSGEGSDETLGGYVRYRPLLYPRGLRLARNLLPRFAVALHVNSRVNKLARFLELGSLDRFVLFNACNVLPADLIHLGVDLEIRFPFRETVLEDAKVVYPHEPARQAMYSDAHTFLCSLLDRNDRMSMGASIECRVPFLDYRLVERLGALPTSLLFKDRRGKHVLRASVGDRLPASVLRHQKWGFGVPWRTYLRRLPEFRELIADLPTQQPISDGPFDRTRLGNLVRQFLAGDNKDEALLNQLLQIVIWHRACLSGSSYRNRLSSAAPI
jgi:asparagine synthase (glutamine-hydrolysing)